MGENIFTVIVHGPASLSWLSGHSYTGASAAVAHTPTTPSLVSMTEIAHDPQLATIDVFVLGPLAGIFLAVGLARCRHLFRIDPCDLCGLPRPGRALPP